MSLGVLRWASLIKDWVKYGKEVYFLFYEELKEDPIGEMEKLLEYLKIEVNQSRMRCIEKHLTG